MKKGERVLCLKRQLSYILSFQLTVALSTTYEYLSKKTLRCSLSNCSGLLVGFFFFQWNKAFHFTGMNFPYPISFPKYKTLKSHCCEHSEGLPL